MKSTKPSEPGFIAAFEERASCNCAQLLECLRKPGFKIFGKVLALSRLNRVAPEFEYLEIAQFGVVLRNCIGWTSIRLSDYESAMAQNDPSHCKHPSALPRPNAIPHERPSHRLYCHNEHATCKLPNRSVVRFTSETRIG